MTTLRDMPMITIEQKNRFREAAMQIEAERDRLEIELENRSHEDDMSASDAYHHCADLIEPHVVDTPHGTECNEQSLCRTVCGSLAYLIAHWQEARGLREERDALAAWLDECLSAMRHASEFLDEFDKDAALALHRMNSLSSRSRGPDVSLTARDARMKAEALEELAAQPGMEHFTASRSAKALAAEYREQAEGES